VTSCPVLPLISCAAMVRSWRHSRHCPRGDGAMPRHPCGDMLSMRAPAALTGGPDSVTDELPGAYSDVCGWSQGMKPFSHSNLCAEPSALGPLIAGDIEVSNAATMRDASALTFLPTILAAWLVPIPYLLRCKPTAACAHSDARDERSTYAP